MPGGIARRAGRLVAASGSRPRRVETIGSTAGRRNGESIRGYDRLLPVPLGMSFRDGRSFTAEDRLGSEPVAIVSQSLAERLWPHRSSCRRTADDLSRRPCGGANLADGRWCRQRCPAVAHRRGSLRCLPAAGAASGSFRVSVSSRRAVTDLGGRAARCRRQCGSGGCRWRAARHQPWARTRTRTRPRFLALFADGVRGVRHGPGARGHARRHCLRGADSVSGRLPCASPLVQTPVGHADVRESRSRSC